MNSIAAADPTMAELIEIYGEIERPVMNNIFDALAYTVIGQLISSKVASTIQAWRHSH